MTSALPVWVQYVAALSPAIIAGVALVVTAVIQYRQWKTAREKLKLDLLEKRLAVYNSVVRAHFSSLAHNDVEQEVMSELYHNVGSAEFLFDPKLASLIDAFFEAIFQLRELERRFSKENLSGDQLEKIFEKQDAYRAEQKQLFERIKLLIVPAIRVQVPG